MHHGERRFNDQFAVAASLNMAETKSSCPYRDLAADAADRFAINGKHRSRGFA
jgi:hypothetical protein